jgi:molybdopterin-guanine dinucleotide biosynthesis protein MobB
VILTRWLYYLPKGGIVKPKQSFALLIYMSLPMAIGIYGNSDTGKTTLLVQLVSKLTDEGYNVATVKQTKKAISMDMKNKDTWRHHDAGASLVVFSSGCETDFLLQKTMSISEIIPRILGFGCYDLVFIEGANDQNIPKIQVGTGKKRKNTIASYNDNFKELMTIVKKYLKKKTSLPTLCITVNGKNIPLTEFPEEIISKTVLGLVGSLKGVQTINEVTLQLKR